ncbi:site-specific integrase [Erwinia mallotivora]|uniref:site-specific integrase n=1 Tax=Erwinia mallotivora TaxID=69222 RepID=UPI0035E9F1C3
MLPGLRHGELCALAWEDIGLTAKTITVTRNLTSQGLFTPPKTEAGTNRVVGLVDAAVAALRDQLELTRMYPQSKFDFHTREYGNTLSDEKTFVFNPNVNATNGRSGSHYAVDSIGQTWDAAIRKAGLRHRKAYQSRHTYACWSLSAGANPNFIASQMGHADAQMVYQVYGSWMKENDEAQLNILNSKLNDFAPHMPHNKTA